ncbi:GRIP and coiled-coil domain-containing protein 2-like isoform X2 [Leptidea sinapis]|uniref:GRIP and coiled-coil domain-containing protein 2-like isoform X2 n=1 Tax=Leptidea sinapis TaxID=189913 RepID=UPI0021C3F6FD|nr:GRIP and coiled-coil domain-containing protein 2-like isoform X2 [Leptidea sinapis]
MDNSQPKNVPEEKRSPFDDLSREELISKCKGLLILAQKAKQAKSDYQNELDKQKSQLEIAENEKVAFQNNIKTLQELVDSLTEQKLTYITELDSAENKTKVFKEKIIKLEEEVSNLKKASDKREEIFVSTTQKVSDQDNEIISLKRQKNRLIEENEQLINQLTELELRAAEFNDIGLKQREQLELLEQKIPNENICKDNIDKAYSKVKELENNLEEATKKIINYEQNYNDNITKIDELKHLYENEKSKKEKTNAKLRIYKEKILKCAACINQLKNSRLILTNTIKDYSEIIPKWQTEIIKASKIFDNQMKELNEENVSLKSKISTLENELHQIQLESKDIQSSRCNILERDIANLQTKLADSESHVSKLTSDISELNGAYANLRDVTLIGKTQEIHALEQDLNIKIVEINHLSKEILDLKTSIQQLKNENDRLNQEKANDAKLKLQINCLENEKDMLLKEKLLCKENILELENKNRIISEQSEAKIESLKLELDNLIQENSELKKESKEKDDVKELQNEISLLQKENEKLLIVNGILKEEVETLKMSLEQPKDESENTYCLNESLQADIIQLETKLTAYKQENASLLAELKESHTKLMEYDNIVSEYEDAKSKLQGYRTENNELLSEMKEINQVIKERGEAISKLEKAVSEMENLIETLEKDRSIVKDENEKLLKKVTLLETNIKTAEMNQNKNNDDNEKVVKERDNLVKTLREKELLIASLREDLEKLRQSTSNVMELPNDDMSTSTISRAEEHSRMRDLDETFEDKYSKLRLFAVKLKKKLTEATTQLQNVEQENNKLKKLLDDSLTEKSAKDEVDSFNKKEKEKDIDIKKLENELRNVTDNLEKLQAELAAKNQELATEINSNKSTKEQLEKALRDVKKKNVLSLEMEDYERSMKELTSKMEENKKKIIQMESTIDTQESTITTMKTQIKLLEEQIKTEETQNRLLKEELHNAIQDSKEKDSVINAKKDIISKLMLDLEDEKRKNEEADVEMTTLLGEKEKIIMKFGEEKIELNNKIKKAEYKCADLEEKMRVMNMELADLQTEYTSYKVRAQAVLRQNQTFDHSQEEQLKEESAALKVQIESLSQKFNSVQEKYTEQTAELEATRKRAAEASAEASRAQQRTNRLQADLTRLSQQLESERTQHKLQVSTLTQCYKSQINDLEMKLQKETEALHKRIAVLQESAANVSVQELIRDKYMLPVIPKDDASDGDLEINVSMIPREDAEGSESAPSPPLSKSFLSGASRRSPVPLERLLEEGVPEDDSLDTSSLALTSDQEIAELKRKLLAQQQRVKHVTVLLSESERECARMAQLSELLKAELRRVRGSSQTAHNTEYMKNVTLKFLTLPPGDERSRLVPVLQKILSLSSEETQKINSLAKGLDPNPSKGWGSYLPWPGGK